MIAIRFVIGLLCLSIAACAAPARRSGSGEITATSLGTIDFASEPAPTPERLSELLIGQPAPPPARLEYSSQGAAIAVVSLADFQQFCPQPLTPSHHYLVFIDNRLAGQIRQLPWVYRAPDILYAGAPGVGRYATQSDAPLDLPLTNDVPINLDQLRLQIQPVSGAHTLVCTNDPARDASNSGLSALYPFVPVVVGENVGRVTARREGLVLYGGIQIGDALNPEDYAQTNRSSVRAHLSPDRSYAIITIDLGGLAIPGALEQPRDVGYVGVRNGVVEWKVWEDSARRNIGTGMCLSVERVLGEVRPGCSNTGFYFP